LEPAKFNKEINEREALTSHNFVSVTQAPMLNKHDFISQPF